MITLTTAYLAPIHYYSRLYHSQGAEIEMWCNYTKQTYRNRCLIASANGTTVLSIPIISSSTLKCPTKDVRISDHNSWKKLHWQAIVSAYGNSPFFEYYRDDFEPFYSRSIEFLFDFNEQLRAIITKNLHLQCPISYTTEYIAEKENDFREAIHPKKEYSLSDPQFQPKGYYQVFEQKFGFIPNLSIIDLLFNMGPESLLVLRDSLAPSEREPLAL